jgi:peroxiredoxin
MTSYDQLPSGLPVPADDGACAHLPGLPFPAIPLLATDGRLIDVAAASRLMRTVLYIYPRTGRPGEPLPTDWDLIPGARGCTPEACAFRDHHAELRALGAQVFGLSTQSTDYQQEMVERLHLPFPVLSDADLALTTALRLPTFTVDGMTLIKRLTLVVDQGVITHVFYPVFPPDGHAAEVIRWLAATGRAQRQG